MAKARSPKFAWDVIFILLVLPVLTWAALVTLVWEITK